MQRRANTVFLLGAHGVLYRGLTPEAALRPFAGIAPPLAPWHDASPQHDPFHLTTLDVLRGIVKAKTYGFFDFSNFNLERFEHYEAAENGDMNWLIEGRFLAFAGPSDTSLQDAEEGYCITSVDDLLPVFRLLGVTSVVRLNKKYYNERKFIAAGMAHLDLYFLDGSNPPDNILKRFLQFCESTPGAISVRECSFPGSCAAFASECTASARQKCPPLFLYG